MSQPPTSRRPGRPRTEDIKDRPEPQPVKPVTIEVAGIECPACQRGVQPRITQLFGFVPEYTCHWKPLKVHVLW